MRAYQMYANISHAWFLNYFDRYNWRLLHPIMSAPLLIWTFFAYWCVAKHY